MEDWWWTSTSLTEYWRNTWLSELLRLLAEWCDSRWRAWECGDGLLGLLVNTENQERRVWDVGLLPVSKKSRSIKNRCLWDFKSTPLWKRPLMSLLWVFFSSLFLLCYRSVGEYDGNGRQARREKSGFLVWSTGQERSSHSIWAQTADEVHGAIHA